MFKRLVNAVKDFFYEVTDHTLILIVIAFIGVILIWRFNILFDFSINKSEIQGDELPPVEKESETETGENTPSDNNPGISDENNTEHDEKTPGEIHTVIIPSGSTAADIASVLYSKGLINGTGEFLNRSVEMKLDTKLKSGTFNIPSDAELDQIIKIISMTD